MASVRGQSGEAEEDHLDNSPTSDSVQPQLTMHSVTFPSMPMHMYPFAPGMVPSQPQIRSKRRQVKNACTNCQKACKKCDDARPCLRCVKYGIGEECVDSQRKERKKGIKRGPYKKRDGKTTNVEQQLDAPVPQGVPPPGAPTASPPPQQPYMGSVGYPPGYYSQYATPLPPPAPPKPGEAPPYYSHPHAQYYMPVPPPPHPPHGGQEPENMGYAPPPPPHTQFYPAPFMSYAQYAQPYMMPHPGQRPDQMQMGMQYAAYPPMYQQKPQSQGPDVAAMHPMHMGGQREEHVEGREMVGMDGRRV